MEPGHVGVARRDVTWPLLRVENSVHLSRI